MLHQQEDMTKLPFVKIKLDFVLMSSRIPTFQIYVHLHLIVHFWMQKITNKTLM